MYKAVKILMILIVVGAFSGAAIAQDAPAADSPDRPDRPTRDEARKNTDRRRPMREDFQRRRNQWGNRSQEEILLRGLMHNEKLAEKLGISGAQLETLRTEAQAHRAEFKGLEEQLRDCGMKQAELVTQDVVDEDALMQAIDHCFEIRKELAKLKMQQLLLVKRTLTPEQIAAAKELMREHMQKRTDRMRDGSRPDRRPDGNNDRPQKRLDKDLQTPQKREDF